MNLFTRIVCIALLITALIFVAFQSPVKSQTKRVKDPVTKQAERITGDTFKVSASTPKGVRIKAVRKPSKKMLNAIDKGFDQLFAIAGKKEYGYKKSLDHTDYTVYIARADRTENADGVYSPDIAVGAAQYAGSKYDKGGYIYAAGMVISFGPNSFVIAEHSRDFVRVSNVVRYEGEHLVLFHNDRKLFRETADHSRGGGHPILQ